MESRITGFQSGDGVSIVQLATSDQDSFDYEPCGKALAEKKLHVNEVSAAGSVNTVLVLNESDAFVFMMDGDILAGAKQNRVVNTSILLAPRSRTEVPVSCVERGRWRNTSPSFKGTDYTAPSYLRASKASQVSRNLKSRNEFASDQGTIWSGVASYQASFRVASPTSNLSDIFDGKSVDFDRLVDRFSPDGGANGLAVFLGKRLAGIDMFNRKDVYAAYFPKLLRAAAFEASASAKTLTVPAEPEARYRTLDLLDQFGAAQFTEKPGVGIGIDRRAEAAKVAGFELTYEGHTIHLAAFANPD